MGADENVRALEDPGVVHDGLRGGRRELFRRGAVHRHGARGLRAREELRHGDGCREPHGPLGAVLVAVEVAAGAAQRVVLDDDAEVRAGRALAVARHEGRLETRYAGLDVEAVGGEIVSEDLHRALFLPAGLRVARDAVIARAKDLMDRELLAMAKSSRSIRSLARAITASRRASRAPAS